MRALIVDDSSTMRMMLAHLLTELGYQVTEAADGSEALQKLTEGPRPDLVTLDWNMPIMGGKEALEGIRQDAQYKDMRVLVISSETEQENVAEALRGGSDEYLMKPFSTAAFNFKVEILSQLAPASQAA